MKGFALRNWALSRLLAVVGMSMLAWQAQASNQCEAHYSLLRRSSSGYSGKVVIVNKGDTINLTNVTWDMPPGHSVLYVRGARFSQFKGRVSVLPRRSQRRLDSSMATAFIFSAWTSSDALLPVTNVMLNNSPCAGSSSTPSPAVPTLPVPTIVPTPTQEQAPTIIPTVTPVVTATPPSATPVVPTVGPTPQPTQAPRPRGTPAPLAHRDPFRQPFQSTSIWNMPVGTEAVYVPAHLPAKPDDDPWAMMPNVDYEHIILHPDAPLMDVRLRATWDGDRCIATGPLLFQAPVPSDYVVPSDNRNAAVVFLMTDGRTLVQGQPFARCIAGGPGMLWFVSERNADLYGDGIPGAHGGSRLSSIGGSLRIGELRPGSPPPRHAVKLNLYARGMLFNCSNPSDCFRWPALSADTGAVDFYGTRTNVQNTAMKMGVLLAIPAFVNLETLGLETEPAKMLAWTLQNYGAYVVDDTAGPGYAISAENGPDGSFLEQFQADWGYELQAWIASDTPWSRDFQRLMTALYAIDNNGPDRIGGGGTPLQPLAPPLDR